MAANKPRDTHKLRRLRVGLVCGAVALAMVGAAFAAVPLFRAFCLATGYDGTVARAKVAPTRQLQQKVSVSFDTNVRQLPWSFTPEQAKVEVKVGATGMAYFRVVNNSDKPLTGRAVYNVVPEQAGAYVRKLQCFCFSSQTLKPHEAVDFPMVFFIDPGYADDRDTRTYTDITLSYTFFPSKPDKDSSGAGSVRTSSAKPVSPLGGAASAGL